MYMEKLKNQIAKKLTESYQVKKLVPVSLPFKCHFLQENF